MYAGNHSVISLITPILATTLCLAAPSRAGGQELNEILQGDYALTQQEVCVATPMDSLPPTFNRDTLELVAEAEIVTLQSQGVTTFDGRGGWTAEGRGSSVRNHTQPGDMPFASPIPFECEGTYSVNADRSIEDFTGTCTSSDLNIEFGPRTLSGHVSADGKTLVLADTGPTIEEIKISGTDFIVGERVCTAIAIDARLIGGSR